MTTLGREVRLGTASMVSQSGVFIEVDKLDMRKYAARPALAMVLIDYLLHVEVRPSEGWSEATARARARATSNILSSCFTRNPLARRR